MKRTISLPVIALGVLVMFTMAWGAPAALAQGGDEEDSHGGDRSNLPSTGDEPYAPERGAAVYAEFCQACHGPQGEAIAEGPAFVAISLSDDTRAVIENGQDSNVDDGVAMPAYAQAQGGILTDEQIDHLLAYMETWESGDVPPLPEPNINLELERVPNYFGDLETGAAIYARSCAGCHGMEGKGRVPPHFPPFALADEVEETWTAIAQGTDSPYMPGFAQSAGGPLSSQNLEDLQTYIASWELTTPEESPSPQGYSTLLMIMGIGAILLVGFAFMSR